MYFVLYANIFMLCIVIGTKTESSTSVDENTATDSLIIKTNNTPAGFRQGTLRLGFRRRKGHLMWKEQAVSRMKERYGNAFEASTYKIRDDEPRPTPIVMNRNSTGDRREHLNSHLLDLMSHNDTEKKLILESEESPIDMYGACYIISFKAFMKHCYATCAAYRFGGLLFIKKLIARACKADWLKNEDIKNFILDACSMRKAFS